MIVSPGDPLDRDHIRENERLLRRNDYLVDAMIKKATGFVQTGPAGRGSGCLDLFPFCFGIPFRGRDSPVPALPRATCWARASGWPPATSMMRIAAATSSVTAIHTGAAESQLYQRQRWGVLSGGLLPFYQLNSRWSAGLDVYLENLLSVSRRMTRP